MSSNHSPHLVNRSAVALSNSSTPTATTPTPSDLIQPLPGDSAIKKPPITLASSSSSSALAMHSPSPSHPKPPSSSSSPLDPTPSPPLHPTSSDSNQPIVSADQQHPTILDPFSSSPSSKRRSLRRMSSPGTQHSCLLSPSLESSSSLTSKRVHQLGLDPVSSHSMLGDIVIGGECGVADGGKASGIQPPASENWIAHHLTIVLQHSFTVSSPHPIPSHHSGSLPVYCHPPPQTPFLSLTTTLVPDALRNKFSITSFSSFTTSTTTTDDDEDEETDEVEEAESQDSTASSCYFPNLSETDPSYPPTSTNHALCPSTPRSRPTSPPSSQTALPPPIITPSQSSSSRLELLQILNTWSFDANSLSPLQIRSSLHILLSVYLKYTPGFLQQLLDLGVVNPQACLRGLVDNLEVAYDSRNAYHNFRHAVDVVQAVYTILAHEGVVPPLGWVIEKEFGSDCLTQWHRQPVGRVGLLLDEMTVWALLLASAGHDVGHPGLSNAFMVNARTPIAYVFSDGAVLENFHRITFTRMLREHGFQKIVDGHIGFRQVLAGAVLATDMGRHFPIVEELKRLLNKWATSTQELGQDSTDALAEKVLIAAGLIKCGDISNSTRPHQISLTWSSCLLNEWSRQAALEADLQLPVSVVTLDPAEKRAQAKSQIGFTSLFVLPLFTVMEQLSPRAFRPFADNGRLGLKTWQRVVDRIDKLHSSNSSHAIGPLAYSSDCPSPQWIDSCTSSSHAEETSLSASGPSLIFSPLSGRPCDELDSQSPHPMNSTSFFPTPPNCPHDSTVAHATPKSKAGGWWGGPSSSPSACGLPAADSTLSSISSSSASTIQDLRISPLSRDHVQPNVESPSPLQHVCNNTPPKCTVGRAAAISPVDEQLLSPHCSFTVKVSLSHSEHQGSASSSSDEGKANSSNDDFSFSSLGSPSSPPRSPYFTPGVYSASSTSSSHEGPTSRLACQDSRFDSPTLQKPFLLLQPDPRLQSPQRSRDKGMSVDIGLVRRTAARASLPLRKKSYSPHLINQQVACAKGCGKVTVKCVKCATESKLKMYRSLSLIKPSLFLRPERIPGMRSTLHEKLDQNVPEVIPFRDHDYRSFAKHPSNVDKFQYTGTSNSLAGLLKQDSTDPFMNRLRSSNQEHNWPPDPFRPLS